MTTLVRAGGCLAVIATMTLSAALGATAQAAGPAGSAGPASGGTVSFKTRAVTAMVASAAKRTQRGAPAGQLRASAAAVSVAHQPRRGDRRRAAGPRGTTGSTSIAPLAMTSGKAVVAPAVSGTSSPSSTTTSTTTTTTAPTCTQLALDVTPTNDRVWVHWTSVGLPSYTIWRMRDQGAWTQIHVAGAGDTSYLDLGVNPRAYFSYRITGTGLSCDLSGVSMATTNDWGYQDAVWGASSSGQGAGPLAMQDVFSLAMPSSRTGMNPAFSPDGRRVVVANSADGVTWTMDVLRVNPRSGDPRILQVPIPSGWAGAEPAWSPDGRTVVYTRYQLDPTTHALTASQLWLFDAQTGSTHMVPGSESLLAPDWRSASTLVAAGLGATTGLYLIPAAGGTATAIANTDSSGDPRVGPDGRIWFVSDDGTNRALRYISPTAGNPVTTYASSTTHRYSLPRISPDGTLFVVDEVPDPANPNNYTFTVTADHFDGAGMQATSIGASVNGSLSGFTGYDVRQPKSKGTSDFAVSAGSDIVARDSSGNLWVYPSTPSSFAGTRVSVSPGWNIYNTLVAAGDLTGDNRADLLARDAQGVLWRYDGVGNARLRSRVEVGSGWNGYLILAPGDFNGDGIADLLGRDPSGTLWLYPGTGMGTFGSKVKAGTGWQVMNAVEAVGDFNLDNHSDLIARDAYGKLWLYPGNGLGGFGSRRQVGQGWNIFTALLGPELLGNNPVVYARRSDGLLLAYVVIGDGRFDSSQVYVAGTGWSPYLITS